MTTMTKNQAPKNPHGERRTIATPVAIAKTEMNRNCGSTGWRRVAIGWL